MSEKTQTAAERPATCPTNTETIRRTLICHVCGSTETRSQHCKVFCVKCGYLIENCSGD